MLKWSGYFLLLRLSEKADKCMHVGSKKFVYTLSYSIDLPMYSYVWMEIKVKKKTKLDLMTIEADTRH